jgi:hypothetical protein
MFTSFRAKVAKSEPHKYTSPSFTQPGPPYGVMPPSRTVDPGEQYTDSGYFPRRAGYTGPYYQRYRIAVLEAEARKVTTPSGSRASKIQKSLLQMVFDKITPFPDHDWMNILIVASKR